MSTIYLWFKFLHIAAAGVWFGGLIVTSVLNARLARAEDPAVIAATARLCRSIGAAVLGPSAGLTLIAGGVAMGISGLDFVAWIAWGFAAIALSIAVGATVVRRAVERLLECGATATHGDPEVAALQRRIAIANAVLAALLLSAIWAMVFKPTF